MSIETIYEVIDTTNDEIYYPLGLFLSFDDARKWVGAAVDNAKLSIAYMGDDDREDITIRERPIGPGDHENRLVTISRVNRPKKDSSDENWVIEE